MWPSFIQCKVSKFIRVVTCNKSAFLCSLSTSWGHAWPCVVLRKADMSYLVFPHPLASTQKTSKDSSSGYRLGTIRGYWNKKTISESCDPTSFIPRWGNWGPQRLSSMSAASSEHSGALQGEEKQKPYGSGEDRVERKERRGAPGYIHAWVWKIIPLRKEAWSLTPRFISGIFKFSEDSAEETFIERW